MGMSLGGGDKGRPSPNVNVTPLVDVALVVLIIFMVVTPLMTKTFWLNLPPKPDENARDKPPKDDDESNKPLVLTIDHDGVIRANKTQLSRAQLTERLPRMLAAKKHKVLYFDAHDDVPYGTAVEVMDIARGASARSIAILTEKVAQ